MYKVGDRVVLTDAHHDPQKPRPLGWVSDMDKYLGATVTIRAIYNDSFRIEDDLDGWVFWFRDIVGLANDTGDSTNDDNDGCEMCSECGELTDDYSEDADFVICNSCMQSNGYDICDDCGCISKCCVVDKGYYYEKYVCEDCIDGYSLCDECHRAFSYRYISLSDGHANICEGCSCDYNTCYDCNCVMHRDETYERNGRYYCESCDPGESVLLDYCYKPDPIFKGNTFDGIHPYMGVELEIDEGDDRDDCAYELNEVTGDIYLKDDGSLNYGIEIITHPATLQYHTNTMPWSRLIRIARSYGFKSHDAGTCGLHVHINRDFFHGSNRDIQDLHIAKILLIINYHWDNMVKFSRRRINDLAQWAKKPDLYIEHSDTEEDIVRKAKDTENDGRYQALNLENYHTIEFRMFRGTLALSTIIATLQFVEAICQFAKSRSLPEIQTSTWEDIVQFIVEYGYEELIEYLEIRHIMPESLIKQEELELCV